MHGKGGGMRDEGVCIGGSMRGEGGMLGRGGTCVAGETATAADGTHPTGMHSCIIDINLPVRTSNHNFNLSD